MFQNGTYCHRLKNYQVQFYALQAVIAVGFKIESNGMTAREVADRCEIPLADVEKYLMGVY